ncbi:luciferin 4-monooxygenase-like [Choristoneura fumiferana]|uniref:luciferin 4-monooxygenase-like n=1 Tax=Choristoneura fumiferana TaxID=7141 RepID=UPI003D157E8A
MNEDVDVETFEPVPVQVHSDTVLIAYSTVVDPKTRALLGPKQIGEICIKSPTVTQGYINLNLADYTDEDNFFLTGDLGYYDEDKDFFILDRFSNFILWNGYKVSPGELENVLLQHPAVLDVGVIGRPAPVVHEVPMAFVVKKPGSKVSEEDLIAFVASQVSPQMQLRGGVVLIRKYQEAKEVNFCAVS